jgi:LEA14-like dessication related protein
VKILFVLALSLLSSLDLFKEPQFVDARNFKLRSLGIKQSTIHTDLYYFNPNNASLNLKEADLNIYIDGRFAGHSLLDTFIQIPARDTFAIPVNVDVEMKNVFPNALAILMNEDVELKIEGKAKIGKAGIYLNIPVRYKERMKLIR